MDGPLDTCRSDLNLWLVACYELSFQKSVQSPFKGIWARCQHRILRRGVPLVNCIPMGPLAKDKGFPLPPLPKMHLKLDQ